MHGAVHRQALSLDPDLHLRDILKVNVHDRATADHLLALVDHQFQTDHDLKQNAATENPYQNIDLGQKVIRDVAQLVQSGDPSAKVGQSHGEGRNHGVKIKN